MRRQKMQKQHLLGAGFIATLVAIYPFAANLGVVPQDATQLIKIPPGLASITLPNGTHISLSELQQQVHNNPNLAGLVNNLLQQYNASNGTNYSLPNLGSGGSYASGYANGQSGTGYGGGGWGQSTNQPAYGTNPYGNNNTGLPSTYETPGGYGTNPSATHLTSYGGGMAATGAGDVSVRSFVNGNCTQFIQEEIQRAQRKIFIQGSSFTSKPIADSLIQAHQRHVEVYVILDRMAKMENYSQSGYLAQYGVPVLFSDQTSPSKFMLVDGLTVLSSGFNFTNQAETANAEHMMVSRNRPDIYQSFENTFQQAYQRVASNGSYQRTGAADYGGAGRMATNPYPGGGYANPTPYGSGGNTANGFGNGMTYGTSNANVPLPSTSPSGYRTGTAR